MTRLLIRVGIAISVGVWSLAIWAQSKPKLSGEDWVQLFNSTDLSGWTKIGNESWTVENGLIHGKGLTQDYGYLQTEKSYKDFQLSLRFKCVGDGNSGNHARSSIRN